MKISFKLPFRKDTVTLRKGWSRYYFISSPLGDVDIYNPINAFINFLFLYIRCIMKLKTSKRNLVWKRPNACEAIFYEREGYKPSNKIKWYCPDTNSYHYDEIKEDSIEKSN